MRLSFSNGEHADVIVDNGVTGIGSAQGNTIVLGAAGVAPWHARIVIDKRGMILEVLDPQARTHVNARPIQERALLRLGDVVNFDAVAAVLKPDHDAIIDTRVPAGQTEGMPGTEVSRVVLRGLSGAHFGKTISVGARLLIGSDRGGLGLDDPDSSAQNAVLVVSSEAIHLKNLEPSGRTEVNGVSVHDAVLHPGDQLVFGRNRFILEAPGYPVRGQGMPTPANEAPAITQTLDAIQMADPVAPAPEDDGSGIWWLILAAGVIGLGIAGLLWFGNY